MSVFSNSIPNWCFRVIHFSRRIKTMGCGCSREEEVVEEKVRCRNTLTIFFAAWYFSGIWRRGFGARPDSIVPGAPVKIARDET